MLSAENVWRITRKEATRKNDSNSLEALEKLRKELEELKDIKLEELTRLTREERGALVDPGVVHEDGNNNGVMAEGKGHSEAIDQSRLAVKGGGLPVRVRSSLALDQDRLLRLAGNNRAQGKGGSVQDMVKKFESIQKSR